VRIIYFEGNIIIELRIQNSELGRALGHSQGISFGPCHRTHGTGN
jgi:hypothetical protein